MSPTTIPGNFVLQSPAANDPLLDLNTQPSLDLQFATSKTLDDRVSGLPLVDLQRDVSSGKSAGTYVDSTGVIRISKVNLLNYSEEFDSATWSKLSASIDPNTITSPYGLNTADKLIWSNGSTTGGYVAKGGIDRGTATNPIVLYTLTGAGTSQVISALPSGSDYGVINVGSGWYRCWLYDSTADETLSVYAKAGEFDQIQLQFYTTLRYIYARDSVTTQGDGTSGVYIWGAQLEEGSTASPYIKTTNLPSAAPRFDHDPTTNTSLGLLVEESRTNLAKYSEPDDRSTNGAVGEWYLYDLDPNTEITKVEGPDGVSNSASEMQLATGSVYDTILYRAPVTPGASYTFSAWVKLGTATNLALHVNNGLAWNTIPDGTYSFDVNDGLNTNTFVKVSHTFTAPSTGMVNVSTGRHLGTAPVQQTQGTVTVWGCQLELGTFSSSTIITSGSTVTRAADVASITGSNFSRWYNQSEGTIFAEAKMSFALSQTSKFPDIYTSGTFPDRLWSFYLNNGGNGLTIGADTHTAILETFSSSPQSFKVAQALSNTSLTYSASKDGATPLTGSRSKAITNASSIAIGLQVGAVRHIARLTYYPYRLPDATLQEITS